MVRRRLSIASGLPTQLYDPESMNVQYNVFQIVARPGLLKKGGKDGIYQC